MYMLCFEIGSYWRVLSSRVIRLESGFKNVTKFKKHSSVWKSNRDGERMSVG